MLKISGLSLMAALCLAACSSTSPTVADYGMGHDSAAIKDARSKSAARVTVADLEQSRRQRTNVKEEMELEDVKRQRKIGSVNNGVSTIDNVLSIFR